MSIYWNDGTSLYHHGIAGQKWGVRNGPPYPLDYKEHSKREIRGEYRDIYYKKRIDKHKRSTSSSNNTQPSFKDTTKENSLPKKKLSDVISSRAFKIGATAAVATLALVGAYKITHDVSTEIGQEWMMKEHILVGTVRGTGANSTTAMIDVENKYLDRLTKEAMSTDAYKHALENGDSLESKLSSMYGSSNDIYGQIMNDDSSEINKGALKSLLKGNNTKFGLSKDTAENCRMCTTSLIMRLKGYDTSAGLSHTGWSDTILPEIWDGAEVNKIPFNSFDEWYNSILSRGEGHYGDMTLSWNAGGGHSVLWLNKGGRVHIIDGQSGEEYAINELQSQIKLNRTRFCDVTDCKPTEKVIGMVMDKDTRANSRLKVYNAKNAARQIEYATTQRQNRKVAYNYYKKQYGDTLTDKEIRRMVRDALSN